MIALGLPPQSRRYAMRGLALLLPLLLLGMVWVIAVGPVAARLSGLHAQSENLTSLIIAERRHIADTPAMQKNLARLQLQETKTTGALPGATEALAAEAMQNDVQDIISDSGGQIISIGPLPSTTQSIYEVMTLQVTMLIPSDSLADFLRKTESNVPYLFIKSASFQPSGSATGDAAAAPPALTVTCAIAAYWQPAATR